MVLMKDLLKQEEESTMKLLLRESEDEKIRKEIVEYIKIQQRVIKDEGHIQQANDIEKWIAWLEKQGEQKPTWSEEDEARYYGVLETEQYMLDVVNGIKKLDVGNEQIREECTKELTWLKSLKERYTWKPSDEQMKVLNEVINYAAGHQSMHWNDYVYNILKQFKSQLKKMKGE